MTGGTIWYKTSLKVLYIMVCMAIQVFASDGDLPGESCHTGAENKYRQSWVFVDGVKRCCDTCRRGDYMKEVCDIDKPHTTTCIRCHYGTYTDLPNLRESCMPLVRCDYAKHMVVKISGSRIRNYVCECQPGFYELQSRICKQWRECPRGSGVLIPGNSTSDIVCHVCPKGTFANEFDRTPKCLEHTNCESQGLLTLTNGTSVSDAICHSLTLSLPTPSQEIPSSSSVLPLKTHDSSKLTMTTFVLVVFIVAVIIIVTIIAIVCWRSYGSSGNTQQHSKLAQEPSESGMYTCPQSDTSIAGTDYLPAGAEALTYPPMEPHRNCHGNLVTPAQEKEPTDTNRGIRHPASQFSSDVLNMPRPTHWNSVNESSDTTLRRDQSGFPHDPFPDSSSVFGLSEAGSHPSRTTQADLGRIRRTGDDGMPGSGSDYPLKDRNVHRQAEQPPSLAL